MFNLKDYDVPIDLLIHVILRFVSYFDLDHILPCFWLTPKEIAQIKYKIYKQRAEIVRCNYYVAYLVENTLHRIGGPAMERTSGLHEWWLNGKRHREDGPAMVDDSGELRWYQHGKKHREDGPAIVRASGSKEWYFRGKRHRIGGPAIEDDDGIVEWWVDGIRTR